MNGIENGLALFLLANLLLGLPAVARGPTPADRMLAALLFGSTGVGILVLLGAAPGAVSTVDVALTLALLAAISGAAFVLRAWRMSPEKEGEGADD